MCQLVCYERLFLYTVILDNAFNNTQDLHLVILLGYIIMQGKILKLLG